ncbi:MAG: Na+/H+ antiporter NhaC family protein [Thermoguttaceae bacterium]|nr:Na+/H+ antiporter NhaC family protein [Thermoguttaceae bacterium]
MIHVGAWSLVPALLAVALAFLTREAVFSLLVACVVGLLIAGEGFWGLPELFQRALGNPAFIWVLLVELCIGVLVAFFLRSASTEEFARRMGTRLRSRKQVQLFGWFLGMLIFFSDYFSPLLTGPVLRSLTDRVGISREKLAFICDSTSAPMCVLVPFSAWAIFLSGLLVGIGPIADTQAALSFFIHSVVLDFYAWIAVAMVGLIAAGLVPDFGPMRRAENRASNEGKPLADGAVPMMSVELSEMKPAEQITRPRLTVNFFVPLAIVVSIAVGSYAATGSARILEAFMSAVAYLGIVLWLQRVPMKDLVATSMQGIKGVVPALLLLALAYSINAISQELGAAAYVVEATRGWLTPTWLPLLTFVLCGLISFSTGTSWGTYAIVMPIAMPVAFEFSGGAIDSLSLATLAALAGGGVFGDHCSPLSDTTILSSFGAASDHMDHVKTQLPYALAAAALSLALYAALGLVWWS